DTSFRIFLKLKKEREQVGQGLSGACARIDEHVMAAQNGLKSQLLRRRGGGDPIPRKLLAKLRRKGESGERLKVAILGVSRRGKLCALCFSAARLCTRGLLT